MENNWNREYAKGSLSLKQAGHSKLETFEILSTAGEGGTCVCYDAIRHRPDGTLERGKLKEFYPADNNGIASFGKLKRDWKGSLYADGESARKFGSRVNSYSEKYKKLKNAMAEGGSNELLKRYVQSGEIYHPEIERKDKGRQGTVYIWSAGLPGQSFDDYISQLHQNPLENTGALEEVLRTLRVLTDCISVLHTGGITHNDIKPSNFLVSYDGSMRIDPANISLFDIDSFHYLDEGDEMEGFYSHGFSAPEAKEGKPDYRSDIFSLGAMLYYALNDTAKADQESFYNPLAFTSIDEMVKNSPVIKASGFEDALLHSRIVRVLKKSLAANPMERYQSSSDMKRDIELILDRLSLLKYTPGEKNTDQAADSGLTLQMLLYNHALYEVLSPEETELNVLCIGDDEWAQTYMDIVLETAQSSSFDVHIISLSEDGAALKDEYLSNRPALSQFIEMDGKWENEDQEPYGKISFLSFDQFCENEPLHFSRNMTLNKKLAARISEGLQEKGLSIGALFVSLPEERIASAAARGLAEALAAKQSRKLFASFTANKTGSPKKLGNDITLIPVSRNERTDLESVSERLADMAFNTHMSWLGNINADIPAERSHFFGSDKQRDKDNRSSSASFALSVKYKLQAVGLADLSEEEAARRFQSEVLDVMETSPEAKELFLKMCWLEHRRWLIERICKGWQNKTDEKGNPDLEGCVGRKSVKDEGNKIHPCIVASTTTQPLNTWSREQWDSESTNGLDPLDKMSVDLHRVFRKEAGRLKKEFTAQSYDMNLMEDLCRSQPGGVAAFNAFKFAVRSVVNGAESYSRQFKHYVRMFLREIEYFPSDIRKLIEERVSLLEKSLFPFLEANQYRDYKKNDETLIRQIPYILTYKYVPSLTMAFEDGFLQDGENHEIFKNVASLSVLSPQYVRYLYVPQSVKHVSLFLNKAECVINYIEKRGIRCEVEFKVACPKDVDAAKLQEELTEKLQFLCAKGKWIRGASVTAIQADTPRQASDWLLEFVQEDPNTLYDGSTQLFHSFMDDAYLLGKLMEQKVSYFEFDSAARSFSHYSGCDYLQYFWDSSYLRVSDLFALMNIKRESYHVPEFGSDYRLLWDIYTGKTIDKWTVYQSIKTWNMLSQILVDYDDHNKPVAVLELKREKKKGPVKTLTYILPDYAYTTAVRLVKKLVKLNALEEGSVVETITSEECRVSLIAKIAYETILNELFGNAENFLPMARINARIKGSAQDQKVVVEKERMNVRQLDIDPRNNGENTFRMRLLRELAKHGYLRNLKTDPENPNLVSFTYSSRRIKNLLTSAGQILEVYAYYSLLEEGCFDDLVTGYEFQWDEGKVTNEMDLIVTKGFKSYFIEAKSVTKLTLDYYHKLHSLVNRFGINTTSILLGNTYSESDAHPVADNPIQRSRGKQLSIQTISDPEEVEKIGATLKRIILENEA